jgi:hypothetical protein
MANKINNNNLQVNLKEDTYIVQVGSAACLA